MSIPVILLLKFISLGKTESILGIAMESMTQQSSIGMTSSQSAPCSNMRWLMQVTSLIMIMEVLSGRICESYLIEDPELQSLSIKREGAIFEGRAE